MGRRLLLVDDDRVFTQTLQRVLQLRGHQVDVAHDLASAQAILAKQPVDGVVLDLRLGQETGLALFESLPTRGGPRVLLLTGYGSIATAVKATKLGAANFLSKPASADAILAHLFDPDTAESDDDVPSLARVEWEHMQRVLEACQGNVSEAARRLGMHRRSLQRKLQKMPPAR